MSGYTDFEQCMKTGLRYTTDADIDVQAWDDWFIRVTYDQYKVIRPEKLEEFLIILQRLHLRGQLEGYDFLFAMPEYDRQEWIRRAHRDCHKLHVEDADAFPVGGFKESFDLLRLVRKNRAKAKKEASRREAGGLNG